MIRPDGEGAELRLRELEVLKVFLDLGGELAQLALERAQEARGALADLSECHRLLGESTAFTAAANRINALSKSFQ